MNIVAYNKIGNKRFLKHFLCLAIALMTCICSQAYIVVLDAGHGGKDPGALGTYSKEKNINLNVVLKLGKLITDNCKGVEVRYTRKTDIFVELDERARIANKANADLFISVHTNSVDGSKTAAGSETYSLSLERAAQNLDIVKRENSVIKYETNLQKYNELTAVENSIINEIRMRNNMRSGAEFAQIIQSEYKKAGRIDKGNRQAGFLVLRKTSMPSVLTELGFISTPSEEAYLNSEEGINELANSIFRAFKIYVSPILREQFIGNAQQVKEEMQVAEESEPEPVAQPQPKQQPAPQAVVKQPVPSPQPKQEPKAQPKQEPKAQPKPEPKAQPQAKPAEKPTEPKPAASAKEYEFRVQFLISDKQLRQDNEQFKGLKDIKSYETPLANNRRQFGYTTGQFTSYQKAKEWQQKVVQKYPKCFVVVFKDDKRVTGDEEAAAKRTQK